MKLDARKIKMLLAEREMNQSDLARQCGVARQQLGKILARESCTTKMLGKIAKGLGVPVSEIIKEE